MSQMDFCTIFGTPLIAKFCKREKGSVMAELVARYNPRLHCFVNVYSFPEAEPSPTIKLFSSA
jgi:hypothetical protein